MNRGKIKGSNISGEEVGNQKWSHCSRKQRSLWCLSRSFSIVAHKVCLLVSAIFNPNLHRKSVSVRAKDLHRTAQLSADACAEQPQNSSEKVEFFVSCTVHMYWHTVCYHEQVNTLPVLLMECHTHHEAHWEISDQHHWYALTTTLILYTLSIAYVHRWDCPQ